MGFGTKPWYDLTYRDVATGRNVTYKNMAREETRDMAVDLCARLKAGKVDLVKVTNRFGVDVTVDFFGDRA